MLLAIDISSMIALNIILLLVYLILLATVLAILLFRKRNRLIRMIVFSVTCILFSKTISDGIILPIHGAVKNIEYLTSLDADKISDKDAKDKWTPIYVMLEKFPGANLLIAIAAGLSAFYITKLISEKVRSGSINLIAFLLSAALTIIFFRQAFQAAIITPVSILAAREEVTLQNGESGGSLQGASTTIGEPSHSFPLSYVLEALGFGILCYLLLNYLFKRKPLFSAPADGKAASVRLINGGILFILAFSVFLVVSVFVAIPILNEINRPSVYTPAKLDSAFSLIANSRDSLIVRLNAPKKSDVSPLSDTSLNADFTKLLLHQRGTIYNQIQSVNLEWGSIIRRRNEIIDRLNNYGQTYKSREATFRQGLVNSFDVSANNSIVNKGNLYEFAVNRFISYRQTIRTIFENTDNDIALNDIFNENALRDIKLRLESTLSYMDSTNYQPIPVQTYFVPYSTAFDQIEGQLAGDFSLQAENRSGREWGFLGVMSDYLIKTHSSELVLLIGMLGFGLLGASLLSFAPRDENSNFIESLSVKPLINNFGGVLARGFGAALIVYLATKGGLALFTLGGAASDPNGYILLLACFIGAVFSERVWTRISNAFGAKDAAEQGEKDKVVANQDRHS
ncbi:MAG TPA: hypothetical protein VKQ52_19245 [Puia sp.]|nr:hypothetical protein [Puia sp.]